jgi:hypothetical protein
MTLNYEAEILHAIAAGINAHDLQRMDPWEPRDVVEVMRRHRLAVTAGGSLVKADVPLHAAVQLAEHSPSPKVRQQAARAKAHLVSLAEALGAESARLAADDLRRHQRLALSVWIEWLRQAATEAEGEKRRLTKASPRSLVQQKKQREKNEGVA